MPIKVESRALKLQRPTSSREKNYTSPEKKKEKKRIIYLHTLRAAFQQRELTAPSLGWFDACSFEEAVFVLLSYFLPVKSVFGIILHLWFMVWNAHTQAAPSPP